MIGRVAFWTCQGGSVISFNILTLMFTDILTGSLLFSTNGSPTGTVPELVQSTSGKHTSKSNQMQHVRLYKGISYPVVHDAASRPFNWSVVADAISVRR